MKPFRQFNRAWLEQHREHEVTFFPASLPGMDFTELSPPPSRRQSQSEDGAAGVETSAVGEEIITNTPIDVSDNGETE